MFEAKNGPYERHLTLHGALMHPAADKTREAKVCVCVCVCVCGVCVLLL